MIHRLLTATACLLVVLFTQAQTGKLFDADKQLSSSFTSQVYLDHDGFIWVATRNGLNRYDGYQFHIIKKEQEGERGMASNYVNCITQDQSGLFYLGMYGALQTYDGTRFRDIEVKDLEGHVVTCYVTCFLQRSNGEILAGTSGHGLLQIADRNHARQLNGSLKEVHTIHELAEDRQGHVWIVTNRKGLLEYDGKTTKAYFNDEQQQSTVRRVCTDQEGNVYVGTANSGVFVRSAKGGPFTHIAATGNKHVSALYITRQGQLLIGYDGLGTAIYNPKTGQIKDNPYFSHDVDLSRSKVYSITEDAAGNVWLGLLQKGIFMQPRDISGFSYMGYKLGSRNVIGQACVVSTLIDRKGRCWVGTDKDGLYCLDENQRLLNHFSEGFPATVISLCEDSLGRIWVGSYGEGFGYIDPAGKTWHKLSHYPTASIFALQATARGDLWIATMGNGLLRLSLSSPPPFRLEAYTMQQDAPGNPSANSIVNNYLSGMSVSPDGKRVYVATTMGVCCYDILKQSWTSYFGKNTPKYGLPTLLAKEYDGRLWVGTNDGLFTYDAKSRQLQQYTTAKSLTFSGISSIEQDKEHRLWIGTDHGLVCLDPKTGKTRSFFVDNGLQSNEFSNGASFALDLGDRIVLLFGGVGGVTWFHPERISEDKWDAKVSLVSFILDAEPIGPASMSDGYQICDTTVIAAQRFQLAHSDNTFAIQFSTLTYDNPDHITYLYSINGEPFSRLQPGTNQLTISHLPPGVYRFRVKAARNNTETPEKAFIVIIHSPWWRSAWAYCLYLAILGIVIWQLILARRRKEQNRLRLQEHIYAEEMSDAKVRFFINISHEIRTPMTLIVTPLLSLIKNEKDPQRKSVYETIRRNAERILNLINQMMDLRKIDKGLMQMRMTETDLVGFVNEIFHLFEHQANAKRCQLLFEHDAEQLPVWIDRRNFDKVVVNILSNAFKYTPTGGSIAIRLTHDSQHARIAISDNGEKIPEDQLKKIFERFYQSPSTVNDRNVGTGIGLDLTRSLVELHHGTIEAHNLQQGCEFIVTIPLGNSHLKPEEMVVEEASAAPEQLSSEMEEMLYPEVSPAADANDGQLAIVVAEDDSEILEYLSSQLGTDYDIHPCANGRQALSETLRSMPALVISDVMMPEMDGNTLCSKLKSNPNTSHIPIILLTAKNRDEDKLEGLETGADAYIVKPFNMDILRRTIVNLINSRRQLRLKYSRVDELEQQVEQVKVKSPDDKLLDRIMTAINSHLDDSDLSVDMIADEVGISRVHLHRKMKELTGQTPHDFIRNLRLKQAANLLANRGMNVTEVMYACGFSNSASFSTVFKKFYGMSPRDYMKEHGKRS